MYRAASAAFFYTNIMGKINKSITIDEKVNEHVEKQAVSESRSFSNMLETMAKKYLMALQKPRAGKEKK